MPGEPERYTFFPIQDSSQWAKRLYRNVVRISHLLRRVKTLAELGSILLSYLDITLTTGGQRSLLEQKLPGTPRLCCVTAYALGATRVCGKWRWADDCVGVGGWDGTLRVWKRASRECVLTFPVDGALHGCAFHPGGRRLVACGDQEMYFLQRMRA